MSTPTGYTISTLETRPNGGVRLGVFRVDGTSVGRVSAENDKAGYAAATKLIQRDAERTRRLGAGWHKDEAKVTAERARRKAERAAAMQARLNAKPS